MGERQVEIITEGSPVLESYLLKYGKYGLFVDEHPYMVFLESNTDIEKVTILEGSVISIDRQNDTSDEDGDLLAELDIIVDSPDCDDYKKIRSVDLFRGVVEFEYKGKTLYCATVPGQMTRNDNWRNSYFFGNDLEVLREIANTLTEMGKLKRKLYIYDAGWDNPSKEDVENLKKCTWESVILPEITKQEIAQETEAFLNGEQKKIYELLDIPYKRGFIFIGPPGCGKTLTAKIIANTYSVAFICVKDLMGHNPGQSLQSIYEMAKDNAPCMILFEDLDSLLDKYSLRTKFLNILDGMTSYEGILTIATTNHPENIDPALLNRPSRFDKKWLFNLPDKDNKAEYMQVKLRKIYTEDEIKVCSSTIKVIVKDDKPLSFSMLQELIICAAYENKAKGTNLDDALKIAHELIKEQIDMGDIEKLHKSMTRDKSTSMGFLKAGGSSLPRGVHDD